MQIVNGEQKPFNGCKTEIDLYRAIIMQPLPVIKTPSTEFKQSIESGLLIKCSGSALIRSTAAAMVKSLSSLLAGCNHNSEQKTRSKTPEIPSDTPQ